MNISNLPKAVCFHVTSFNHLNKRIKDSCYIPNFTVKESGSEKSVIAQSWDGKPGLPQLQTQALSTMTQCPRFMVVK